MSLYNEADESMYTRDQAPGAFFDEAGNWLADNRKPTVATLKPASITPGYTGQLYMMKYAGRETSLVEVGPAPEMIRMDALG